MSNETKDSGLSRRKLVDRLLPKQDSGPLIGLLGTTYKLQSDFFETDFLPTLLGLGAWDDRSWTSRVAMEKRLAEVEAAAILVDGKQYSGRPRLLRVSVHPVTPDGGGRLHAKILVRVHANAVRLQVGSANLTEPGYRRNREVVADLVASEKAPGLAGVITMALDQMEEGLGAWPESAALVTRQARAFLQNLKRIPQEPSEWFALSGPGRALWQTFLERWPVGEFIQSVTIVSPFWSDEDGADAPVAAFMTALRERGLAPGGRLRLLCDARKANNDNFQPVLPPSFATFDPSPFQIQAQAEAVDPCILPEEYGSDATGLARALHAKVILLEGPTSVACLPRFCEFHSSRVGLHARQRQLEHRGGRHAPPQRRWQNGNRRSRSQNRRRTRHPQRSRAECFGPAGGKGAYSSLAGLSGGCPIDTRSHTPREGAT